MKSRNKEMAIKYREVMDSYIGSGFAHKLSEKESVKLGLHCDISISINITHVT